MNAVLDVLKLRRVKLDYISPPVCPGITIGSGSGSGFLSIEGYVNSKGQGCFQEPPFGDFGGLCSEFLLWDFPPDGPCGPVVSTNVYVASTIGGPYTLVGGGENFVPVQVQVCSPGWWSWVLIDSLGKEGPQSTPVLLPDRMTIPRNSGDQGFSLYKNCDLTDPPTSAFKKVLTTTASEVMEVCLSGYYKLQAITAEGASDLGPPVEVLANPCCCAISIPNPVLPYAVVSVPYSQQIVTSGGEAPLVFSADSSTLPGWLTISATGLASGTPGDSDAGTAFVVKLVVTDALGIQCPLEVSGLVTCGVIGSPPDGACCTAYSYQFSSHPATGVVFSGTVPGGLSLSSTGLVTGTPVDMGAGDFVITVTLPNGYSCTRMFTVAIADYSAVPGIPRAVSALGVWPLSYVNNPIIDTVSAPGNPEAGHASLVFSGTMYGTYRRIWVATIGKCPSNPPYDLTCHIHCDFVTDPVPPLSMGGPVENHIGFVVLGQTVHDAAPTLFSGFDATAIATVLSSSPGSSNIYLDVQFNNACQVSGVFIPINFTCTVTMDITPANPP